MRWMAGLVGCAALLFATGARAQSVDTADAVSMLGWVNAARAQAGVPPLGAEGHLEQLAVGHSTDMVTHRFFAHDSPTTGSAQDRFERAGIAYQTLAENIAYDTSASAAFTDLMNSPGHRRNLLDPSLGYIGIGIVVSPEGYYFVTQDFATFQPGYAVAPAGGNGALASGSGATTVPTFVLGPSSGDGTQTASQTSATVLPGAGTASAGGTPTDDDPEVTTDDAVLASASLDSDVGPDKARAIRDYHAAMAARPRPTVAATDPGATTTTPVNTTTSTTTVTPVQGTTTTSTTQSVGHVTVVPIDPVFPTHPRAHATQQRHRRPRH